MPARCLARCLGPGPATRRGHDDLPVRATHRGHGRRYLGDVCPRHARCRLQSSHRARRFQRRRVEAGRGPPASIDDGNGTRGGQPARGDGSPVGAAVGFNGIPGGRDRTAHVKPYGIQPTAAASMHPMPTTCSGDAFIHTVPRDPPRVVRGGGGNAPEMRPVEIECAWSTDGNQQQVARAAYEGAQAAKARSSTAARGARRRPSSANAGRACRDARQVGHACRSSPAACMWSVPPLRMRNGGLAHLSRQLRSCFAAA